MALAIGDVCGPRTLFCVIGIPYQQLLVIHQRGMDPVYIWIQFIYGAYSSLNFSSVMRSGVKASDAFCIYRRILFTKSVTVKYIELNRI